MHLLVVFLGSVSCKFRRWTVQTVGGFGSVWLYKQCSMCIFKVHVNDIFKGWLTLFLIYNELVMFSPGEQVPLVDYVCFFSDGLEPLSTWLINVDVEYLFSQRDL